jgi:GH35 family endo-1,4-beta-xylanase
VKYTNYHSYERLTNDGAINDPIYRGYVAYLYNFVTANTFYWAEVEPTEGNYNFLPTDIVFAFANGFNQSIRCHNLVWDMILPSYINDTIPPVQDYRVIRS